MNGHSLERMKDVSSAAKMLNELKDQSDASAPGSVPLSSSAAEGATQLVLILSRGAAVPAEGPPGNDGNASRAENVETKQLPRELQKCECIILYQTLLAKRANMRFISQVYRHEPKDPF